MVVANTDLPGRESLVARAVARLVEARWLVGAAAVVLLVFTTSGIIGSVVALVLLALFAAALSFAPMTRAREAAAPVAPSAPVVLPTPTVERPTGFEVFADALPEPCFVLDRRGVVRYANARAIALFPVRAGEPLTSRMRVPDLVSAFNIVAKGGPPQNVEFAERVPTERWFAAWFAPLGNSGSVLLFITDMSEQRKTDRVRVDFVANASHELRTPLASLAGFIETLQGPAREDVAARTRFLGIMREQAERMSRLVNDLLSLSRIEMKAHVRPSERVDLSVAVRHVVDSLEPLARDLGVEIDTHLPAEPVEVTGDRDELIQVFENLVENACKYGQSGKRVEVAVLPPQDGGGPRVSIRDFGPGIPGEHIPRLTERFYRVDVEDSRRHRGTGLGLAIVKHILARHLARLTIASRVGEGATFTVNFPTSLSGRITASDENIETIQSLTVS
jgi:two-component system, OmpR family, phosphate regulon sensor histidine kinase PhoR